VTLSNSHLKIRTRVIRRVEPHELESPWGYLLRVGKANGISSHYILPHLLCLKAHEMWSSDKTAAIASKLRLTQEEWSNLAWEYTNSVSALPRDKTSSYRCDLLRRRFMVAARPRLCSICLSNEMIWPIYWDILFCVACPVHSCELLDECPKCKSLLSLRSRSDINLCRCGFDFRTAAYRPADDSLVFLARLIAQACQRHANDRKVTNHVRMAYTSEYPELPTILDAIHLLAGLVSTCRLSISIEALKPHLINAVSTGRLVTKCFHPPLETGSDESACGKAIHEEVER
jgi:hypothetical protein